MVGTLCWRVRYYMERDAKGFQHYLQCPYPEHYELQCVQESGEMGSLLWHILEPFRRPCRPEVG